MSKKKAPSAPKKVALQRSSMKTKGPSSKKVALMESSMQGKPKQQPLSDFPDQSMKEMPKKHHSKVKKVAKPNAKTHKKGY